MTSSTAIAVDADQARKIAAEAYVYGFPMVDTYLTMYAFSIDRSGPEYKGPFNSILNIARVFTPDDHAFVTPNSDMPYSFAGLDLRAEPIVLSVPVIEQGRYYVFQLMDLYTFNFDYIGTRATGNGGGDFLIAGPHWQGQAPEGIAKVLCAETEMVTVVGRTQLFNPADLDNVKCLQAEYKVQPLSVWLGQASAPSAPALDWPKPLPPKAMRTSLEFFDLLAFLLRFAPTHPGEEALRARFEQIGIVPGGRFDPASLSAEMRAGSQIASSQNRAATPVRWRGQSSLVQFSDK